VNEMQSLFTTLLLTTDQTKGRRIRNNGLMV